MRSTKDHQLVKKVILMPVKHNVFLNLPDVEEMPSHDGETIPPLVSMEIPLRQSVRSAAAAHAAKSKNTALAQAQLSRTETVGNC
ncbi:hypothetical protein TNCV_2641371 [Trichonephila clavipes]|nr:hypothetical protein TNCV_2641371 [Trichonephila clavipes]